jgi:hypothetical protein
MVTCSQLPGGTEGKWKSTESVMWSGREPNPAPGLVMVLSETNRSVAGLCGNQMMCTVISCSVIGLTCGAFLAL